VNWGHEARIYVFGASRDIVIGRVFDRRRREINFRNDVFGGKKIDGWVDLSWAVLNICSSAGAGLAVCASAGMSERELEMRGGESSGVVDSRPVGVGASEASLAETEIGGEGLLTESRKITLSGGTLGREETST